MRRLPWLIAAAILAASCSKPKPDDKIVGSWLGDPPLAKELAGDPNTKGMVDFLKDSIQLELRADHTYTLSTWAEKKGTWKLSQKLVRFEETSSVTALPIMTDSLEFGTVSRDGKRTYSAVLSADEKQLTMLMGRQGDITFHR